MKKHLLLLVLLIAFCAHVQAWDSGVNRQIKGKKTSWRWRIFTPHFGTPSVTGPSKILYVYAADGSRNLYGEVNLPDDMWERSFYIVAAGVKLYFWPYHPYVEFGAGLFKDTHITGVTGLNYTVTSPYLSPTTMTPFNIQVIGNECFRHSDIQGQVINYTPPSVTFLGAWAFESCRSLSGNLVTPAKVKIIYDGTYANCTGMTGSLVVQQGVTQIGSNAFSGCENLSGTLSLREGLQRLGNNVFNSCKRLRGNLYVPNSVNSMGTGVFANCNNFNGALDYADNMTTVPDFTFQNCHNLRGSIVIPNKVKVIGKHAFQNCWSFTGYIGLNNVTSVASYAFENCYRLTGGLNLTKVTSLGDRAFQNCRGLNGSLSLSNALGSIPDAAFYDCHSLRGNLHIPKATSIGSWAFQNCYGFDGTLSLPANLKTIGTNAFINCKKIKGQLVIPNGVISIGERAFSAMSSLSGVVTIPASVKSLGNWCFSGISNIESVTFAPGSQVTTLGKSIWWDDYSLKYIDMTGCVKPVTITISRAQDVGPFGRMAPYTIVYLPNSTNPTLITANQENFVVNGKCDNFKVYDSHPLYKNNRGCDYFIKHQFIAAKANYTRTFSGEDAATLFLPYSTTLPAGMVAYELRLMKQASGQAYFVFAPLPTSAVLQAYKAYVVRVTDGGSHNLPEMHNVVVPVTPQLATTAVTGTEDADWKLNGTTQFISNATAAGMKAYNLNTGNRWLPITAANPNGYIHSFRAFLVKSAGAAPAKSFVMMLDNGPFVTNIDSVKNGEADVKSGRYPFYSLDGKNLGNNYEHLPSGNIYIVNGKKFYKN